MIQPDLSNTIAHDMKILNIEDDEEHSDDIEFHRKPVVWLSHRRVSDSYGMSFLHRVFSA
jgi:hypothetical protein